MKDFEGKVAVITGAASGIGLGFAERAAREKMRVVLADIEPGALAEAEKNLRSRGAEVLAVVTDVARLESVEALRDATLKAFGGVHLLCNNAGVSVSGMTWEVTQDDWTWILGVNLWGVIHGIRAFVPGMIASGEEGHVVNTASMAGLIAGPGMSAYNATKHAVVGISESMYLEQVMTGTRIRTSVLCPGWVNTRIIDSDRNRPAALPAAAGQRPEAVAMMDAVRQLLVSGMSTEEVADRVFDAVRQERFWILTHDDFKPLVTARFAGTVAGENPTPRSPF
jgi:NAD(P)-dependent dehydrogenase (short-subunit alcohol dehydrogenase family)